MSTVGKIIKSTRISKEISIEQVSQELKISTTILKEIESDQNSNNYNIVYLIGHIRTYCNFLELNSNEIINSFKKQVLFKKNDFVEKIPKPNFDNRFIRFHTFIPVSLILVIFVSFYILFLKQPKNTLEYALIPDLPEIYTPIIEKANLDNSKNQITSENDKAIINNKAIEFVSAMASTDNSKNESNTNITLKILNSTWLQLRDESNNIIISKLMEKGEEYTYNMSLEYNITAGNAGNILVVIGSDVRGKIGKYGEVVDSIILDKNFNN